jgi:hypothetical protein
LKQLEGTFEPKPTAVVDSGNGIQGLWRLTERIELPAEAGQQLPMWKHAPLKSWFVWGQARYAEYRSHQAAGYGNPPTKKKQKARGSRVAKPSIQRASYLLGHSAAGANWPHAAHGDITRHAATSHVNVDDLPVPDHIKDLIRGIDDPEYE